jgi:hypothetical protein
VSQQLCVYRLSDGVCLTGVLFSRFCSGNTEPEHIVPDFLLRPLHLSSDDVPDSAHLHGYRSFWRNDICRYKGSRVLLTFFQHSKQSVLIMLHRSLPSTPWRHCVPAPRHSARYCWRCRCSRRGRTLPPTRSGTACARPAHIFSRRGYVQVGVSSGTLVAGCQARTYACAGGDAGGRLRSERYAYHICIFDHGSSLSACGDITGVWASCRHGGYGARSCRWCVWLDAPTAMASPGNAAHLA